MAYQKVRFNKGTQNRLQTGPKTPITADDIQHQSSVDAQNYSIEPA